ncbi:hypothetical protein FACS1894160_4590 [Bacteroidia bacterium]|nr:hypothetical protein FACS1894160_4590 [Bacteroidia bacterium]
MSRIRELVNILTNKDIYILSENEVKKCLEIIFDNLFILEYNLHQGYYMIRVRPDFEYNELVDENELSYKPKHLNHTYQRASVPYDTMLYCCSCERREKGPSFFPYTDIEFGLYISLFETIHELRDYTFPMQYIKSHAIRRPINDIIEKKVTYSIWVVKEPLKLVRVAPYKEYDLQVNDTIYMKALTYLMMYHKADDIVPVTNFYSFLTNEFSKKPRYDNREYLISAQASKLLCNKYKYDGIAYPSVRCDREGINFAIVPHAVDKGMLRCVELGSFQLFGRNDKISIENFKTHLMCTKVSNSNREPTLLEPIVPHKLTLLERSILSNSFGEKKMFEFFQ